MKRTQWIAILLMLALICCVSCKKNGLGEQAVIGEQVEKAPAEEQQPMEQTPSKPAEEQPNENPGKENNMGAETSKKEDADPLSDSLVQRVETNDYSELVRITKSELDGLFDYEIYYYQIENFYINQDGTITELRDALKKDPKILDALYTEWKEDHGNTYMYNDGGSMDYPYESYTAIKMNQLRIYTSPEDYSPINARERSLILCAPGNDLNDVDDLIMLGVADFGYDTADRCYKATTEAEPYPPAFVLKNNGRFTFVFSCFSSFAPQGTYTVEGTKLTLQTQGEFDYKYVFEEAADGWRFIAEESAEIPSFRHGDNAEPICPVPDGTVFKRSYN